LHIRIRINQKFTSKHSLKSQLFNSFFVSKNVVKYFHKYVEPPNSITEILDKFHNSISRVFDKSLTHPNVIIGGDFNLGDIDWASDEPAPRISNYASQHNKFLHLIDDISLSQHVWIYYYLHIQTLSLTLPLSRASATILLLYSK
jgi:hypothetical protein